jgi:hypothetical protein
MKDKRKNNLKDKSQGYSGSFQELVLNKLEKLDNLVTKDDLDGIVEKYNLATKDDLKQYATKEDLKAFATKEDLSNIVEDYNLATKDDLKQFATKEDLKAFATKEDLSNIVEDYNLATKDDLDSAVEEFRDYVRSQRESMFDHFYTKDESDERFVTHKVFNELKEQVNQISDHLVGLDKFIKHEFMLLKRSL